MGSQYFNIQPTAGYIGAKIIGLDLSSNLSDEIISNIRKALVNYLVINKKLTW
jgi:taurine dioxygenase